MNRNLWMLVGAAVAFLLIAYLLSRGSSEMLGPDAGPAKVAVDKKKKIVFPRDDTSPRVVEVPDGGAPVPATERRQALDAMQRALLAPDADGAVFIETNAIRHSPLVERMLKCRQREVGDQLRDMKNELGIDPSEDLDRVGIAGKVVVASGFFEELKLPKEIGEGTAYGDGGRLFEVEDDEGKKITFARVGDGLLLSGQSEADVKAAIDRVEGRSSAGAPMDPELATSEIYGTMGKEFIQGFAASSGSPELAQIGELVEKGAVRMNFTDDAAMSLDLEAKDDGAAQDLAKAVNGAFAVLRQRAQTEHDDDLAALLEQAMAKPAGGGKLSVDLAVPGDFLLRSLNCGADGTPLDDDTAAPAPPAPAPTK